jgi:hypothetical protein
MLLHKSFFVLLVVTGTLSVVTAQPRAISSEQYYAAVSGALSEERKLARRKSSTTQYFTNGKVTQTDEWLYEFLPSGDARYINTDTRGEKVTRREQIEVGGQKFCKRGGGKWERVEASCIDGGITGYSNVVSMEYTLEEVVSNEGKLQKYGSRIVYKWPDGSGNESAIVRFNDSSYFLDGRGLITRRESKGGVLDTKEITRTQVETYEYDPNLKISAPIP